jgi:hypothetical protein
VTMPTVLNSARDWRRCQWMPRTAIVRWHDLCGITAHYGNRQETRREEKRRCAMDFDAD